MELQSASVHRRLYKDPDFYNKMRQAYENQKIGEQVRRLCGPLDDASDASGRSTVTKRLMNPIVASIKLLAAVIEFWTVREDHTLLSKKDVMDGKASNKALKEKRVAFLQSRVEKYLRRLETVEPFFAPQDESEVLPFPMSEKQFIEYSKQCFYLNLFNFMILYKLTEICVLKPTKTFGMKNYNSWVAIMHNSSIILSGQTFTAYQIKHDVIKNLKRKPGSSWCVDHRYIHPLIEYAFFLPFQGNLRLNQLCFTNVAHLSYQLARNVNQKLRN